MLDDPLERILDGQSFCVSCLGSDVTQNDEELRFWRNRPACMPGQDQAERWHFGIVLQSFAILPDGAGVSTLVRVAAYLQGGFFAPPCRSYKSNGIFHAKKRR